MTGRCRAPGVLAALVASLAVVAAACGSSDDEILVSAAASLTDAFAEIEVAYEAANPGVDVVVNLGGSAALREQIIEGAPADVFASANLATMEQVVDAGRVDGDPQTFATNRLVIAVPRGNPAGVEGLADFSRDELIIGLCAEPVPCGGLAREVLAAAATLPSIDTNEPDVRALLTKIRVGELDAGIVYVTDTSDGAVAAIAIPDELNMVARYAIATLVDASDSAAGFLAFVLSADGQGILASHGFSAP